MTARLYIASKSTHGPRWVEMRERGAPFISTWIDESGPGQTSDWRDLTRRCVEEASSADGMIVYAQPGEVLKGALIEWGAALAAGKPVFYVGPPHKWAAHPLVRTAGTVEEAVRGLTGPCTTCRPSILDYISFHELAEVHLAAGFDQTQCPECGLYRWPWELPAPEVRETGLKWEYDPEWPMWELTNGVDEDGLPIPIGWIEQHHFACLATRRNPDSPRLPDVDVCVGTLTTCARALVDAVRKDEPQHGPDWWVTDGRRV